MEIRLANQTLRLESKVRKNGFSLIYHRLGTADILVIKSDRERPLAVVETANQAQKATSSPTLIPSPNQQNENNPLTPNPIDQSRHLLNVTGAKINSPRLTPSRVTRRRVPIFLAS